MQILGKHPHQWAPFQVAGLLHAWQTSHQISWYVYHEGLTAESFHSLQSLSVRCFHVIFGLPGPHFPSKAVLDCTIAAFTCPYQHSLLSFRRRSRSSMPSRTSSSLDLVVTMSCGLTLQSCLITALSFCCRPWTCGFVNGKVSLAWSIALCTQELYMQQRVLKERWQGERTGSSSLNFFQVVCVCVVVESSQPPFQISKS